MNSPIELARVSVSSLASPKRQAIEDVLIGKDVLELLTGAMYVDPLSIYREYIQNACDAIDEAQESGLYRDGNEPRIDVLLDQSERSIRIRDTGVSVPRREFVRRLTAIGGSKKRGNHFRGFRGVGRLSGLGYCQELVFRGRAPGDERVSEISWSGRKLRELLRQSDYAGQLGDAVREIAEASTLSADGYPIHFFEVELKRVTRLKNDVLLNEHEVRNYLAQVAPVPFHPSFSLADELINILRSHGIGGAFQIHINDRNGQVYRPFRDTFPVNATVDDRLETVQPVTLLDTDGDVSAVGWFLHHSYFGAIPKRAAIAGLRLRAGNIQIGSAELVAALFPESRFNAWCVGEIHVLGSKLLPNGRRDDFEPNVHYQMLQGQLSPLLRDLAKTCRNRSELRNRLRNVSSLLDSARDALVLLAGGEAPTFIVDFVQHRVTRSCEKVDLLLANGQLREKDQQYIREHTTKIQVELKSLLKSTRRRVVIRGIDRTRRAAYEDVLKLIYEHTPNSADAHKLASRIVEALRMQQAN